MRREGRLFRKFAPMKHLVDLRVVAAEQVGTRCTLLRLTNDRAPLPPIAPGQFAQVRVDGNGHVFLRRPISIHFVDRDRNELWLLVQAVGEGTRTLCNLAAGAVLNCLLPLGHGFAQDIAPGQSILLCGGGIGAAPLLEYGHWLREHGVEPHFLLAARTADDLVQTDCFARYGQVLTCTDDGSAGHHGLITQHPLLGQWEGRVAVCGPVPMMRAMAHICRERNLPCEVSLENRMACGLGACLCCVEHTTRGNVCVCTEGPVFNINDLNW